MEWPANVIIMSIGVPLVKHLMGLHYFPGQRDIPYIFSFPKLN